MAKLKNYTYKDIYAARFKARNFEGVNMKSWSALELTGATVLIIFIGVGTWYGWPRFPMVEMVLMIAGGVLAMVWGIYRFWTWVKGKE